MDREFMSGYCISIGKGKNIRKLRGVSGLLSRVISLLIAEDDNVIRYPLKNAPTRIEDHEIHRGKGLEVRLSLALSTIQETVQFSSAKFPEGAINGDTTYLHLHNFCMELKGREIFSRPLLSGLSPQDIGPADLTSTYSVCTRRVFGGIGHRTQTFRSRLLGSRQSTKSRNMSGCVLRCDTRLSTLPSPHRKILLRANDQWHRYGEAGKDVQYLFYNLI
ncbi:hypothetical protein TNCV_2137381 [Trichonephila clavipes]|nr:hypothetical protein TNCV_2137381 [Trichonephila clavipes]